jgi:hypothetical protein
VRFGSYGFPPLTVFGLISATLLLVSFKSKSKKLCDFEETPLLCN